MSLYFLSIQYICIVQQLTVSSDSPSLPYCLLLVWNPPPPNLPSPDSCLFSPTLSRDLIEGNHSDEKPPTMMLLCCVHIRACVFMCSHARGGGSSLILPLTNPTTSSPLSLSPPPLKCHAALSTHLPCYPPNKPFVWHREEALRPGERGRDEKEAGRLLLLTGTIVSDLWEHLLNIRRSGVLPKVLYFALLSLSLLASATMPPSSFNLYQWLEFLRLFLRNYAVMHNLV